MIEAKYLCIGDLVKYNNKVYEVEEIDGKSNTIIVKSDTDEVYNTKNLIICDDLQPIEITPKILLKNGWKELLDTDLFRLNLPNNHIDYNLSNKTIKYSDGYLRVEIKKQVRYVYQLQQVLRVLDVDEKYVNISI